MTVYPDISEGWEMVDSIPNAHYKRLAYAIMDHLDKLTAEAVGADRDDKEAGQPYTSEAVDRPSFGSITLGVRYSRIGLPVMSAAPVG
jgi:hypothetical protein